MFRKTLTILSLTGLLLSLGLWVASYFRAAINLPFAAEPIWFAQACVSTGLPEYVLPCDRGDDRADMGPPQPINWIVIHGFEGFQTRWTGRWPWRLSPIGETHVPLWAPTVLFAGMLGPTCVGCHRRRKRKKLGLCAMCGYDLRGSKDRCPECGTEFSSHGATQSS